jgi:3-methyl-2-oxobutanoate hydroxymethyltransferase
VDKETIDVGERRKTIKQLAQMKRAAQPIAMMTAYDYPSAVLAEQAGADIVLIGDSLAQVVQGHTATASVTLDDVVYHTRIVARAVRTPLIVADMPFGTYHGSDDRTIDHVVALVQDGGAHAVKMEGADVCDAVRAAVRVGVPVFGHLGVQPQSVHRHGGYFVQGKTLHDAEQLREDALRMQEAGACAIVLELVTAHVAQAITEALDIPTIGIGSGACCDGQVLVFHDIVGYDPLPHRPKSFVKAYAAAADVMRDALKQFVQDVRSGAFPSPSHAHAPSEEEKR